MSAYAGRVLNGRYRLIRAVGSGSQASVWLAEHMALTTQVAVKLIDPDLAKRPDARERFKREATAAAQLRSPHVVQILDHGIDGDQPFIVMELLDGVTCEERLAESGTFHSAEALRVVRDVALTTSYANERGYVHRDVKPSNVMLTRGGATPRVVLLDPGCARLPEARLTLRGAPHFTPGVAPPEVIRALPTDERTDVFMLAALLLRLTTDHDPFEGVDARTTIETSLAATRPPPLDAFEASIAGAFAPATPAIRRADTLRMAPPPPVVRSLVEVLRDALEPEIAARPSHSELIEVIEDVLTALTPLGELRRAC